MNLQVIKNRIRKVLTYTITGTTFFVIAAFLVLQIPAVQEYLIKRYLSSFSKVVGFNTTIHGFELLWFDRLSLDSVNIYDPENNRMIGAENVMINFKLKNLFEDRDINIDGIYLENAHVYLTKIQETDTSRNLNINVFIHRINERYGGSGAAGRSPRINVGEAVLQTSRFSYVNQYRDSVRSGFNYNQFTINIDESQLQNLLIVGDTTQFNVKTLLATDEETKFRIRELSTFFRLSQQSMEFIGLNLRAGESVVSDTIILKFNGQDELNDFIPKVTIHANLHNTIIRPEDLALFAPAASRLTQPLYVSGVFDGRINKFKLSKMEVGTGRTILRGSLDMDGLPDVDETFIFLRLKNSRLDFGDIAFLFNDKVVDRLVPMGRVTMDGEFLGYPSDFVAKGEFAGPLGRITSDINFKVNAKDFDKSVYIGKLSLLDFNLGQYLSDTINFQKVNLNGNIRGSGLTVKTADFILNGKVSSIGIRGYDYKNISTNARFASQLFNGFFKINDPNLQFTAKGSIDLREGYNVVKMEAQLDTAFLHNLHLSKKEMFLHSRLAVNIQGLHLDSLVGKATLSDFRIHYNDQWLSLKDIFVSSERSESQRRLSLRTTLVDAEIQGDFLLSDISNDIQRLVHEMLLNIRNDKLAIAEYYSAKKNYPKPYQANFGITIRDVDPIVKLLDVDVSFADRTKIEGKFTSGYTSILQLYSKIDSMSYNNSLFVNTDIEVTASKISDSTSVLAMGFVNSERQILSPAFRSRNMVAEAIWNKNHIDFAFDADQEGRSNYVRLKGAIDFLKDSTHIKFLPSTVNVLQKTWDFSPDNLISIHKRNVRIKDLVVRQENQFIAANGMISPDPSKKLTVHVSNFDLASLNVVTGREFSGTLDAVFDLNNYYGNPYVQNDLRIDSLTLDKFLIGDISGKNQWDTLGKKFTINFFVDRNANRIVDLAGHYDPANRTNPLSALAKLQNANLRILEPFLEDNFSNIGGTVTGDFQIGGTLKKPAIDGEGVVSGGTLMVNYLKTVYNFTGVVGLSPNSIYFKNIELSDIFNNHAKLTGRITHDNFYSMRINLEASFQNFQVLNTTAKDNNLFYGQGYATGDINLFGPISNLKITANARTDRNTRIFIPIEGTAVVDKKDFIKFVSFNDSTFRQSLNTTITNKIDLTGISMDFNLAVTPDAYCEIIFDIKAGDIIRGRGFGDLQLQLNTNGEFNMFGPFEFTEGWYNFTLYDIFNKDFVINRGSRINWYGDPYAGVLDIAASYNQNASLGPILSDRTLSEHPQMRRKYPVQVLLNLDGPMLTPDLNFDIVAKDLPQSIIVEGEPAPVRLAFEFQAFKNKMDEQELYRQVFSLIVLRRFSPPESFNTAGSLANSVSELLSNQLSNWASQVDENLEIDVDLSTFDDEAFNTFQLRLSYTTPNGRWRFTRDAQTFYGSQNGTTNPDQQQNTLASLAGDWTVEYLLTADGMFRVKMYNRTNINPILNTIGAQNSVTTGASVTHMQSFNELKDLWRAARNRRKQQQAADDIDANEDATRKDDDGTD
jgi:hypothetical protein